MTNRDRSKIQELEDGSIVHKNQYERHQLITEKKQILKNKSGFERFKDLEMRLLQNKVEYNAIREYYGDKCFKKQMEVLKRTFWTVSRLLNRTMSDVRKYRTEMYELYKTTLGTEFDLEMNKKSWELENGTDDDADEVPENAQRLRDDLWLFVHDTNIQNHVFETPDTIICSPTHNGELFNSYNEYVQEWRKYSGYYTKVSE